LPNYGFGAESLKFINFVPTERPRWWPADEEHVPLRRENSKRKPSKARLLKVFAHFWSSTIKDIYDGKNTIKTAKLN